MPWCRFYNDIMRKHTLVKAALKLSAWGYLRPIRSAMHLLWNNSPKSSMNLLGALLQLKLRKSALLPLARVLDKRPAVSLLSNLNSSVFGEFVTDDGCKLFLYDGYRDRIKRQWRLDYWPTIALLTICTRIDVGSAGVALIRDINSGRTLPVCLDEVADMVAALAKTHPKELIESDIPSPLTKRTIIAARLTVKQADSMASYYRQIAMRMLTQYARFQSIQNFDRLRVLEVGCGMGYAVMALSALGIDRPVGIDSGVKDYRWISERQAVAGRLGADTCGNHSSVKILEGDCSSMDLNDNEFDFIYSASVVEHLPNLQRAFSEMARVLKPGGMMIHHVDPFFSPKGGHASCTLDFPWGHVLLTPSEFRRYLQQWRPYEHDHALTAYTCNFTSPRASLFDLEQIICQTGLTIIAWQEDRYPDHSPTNNTWRHAKALHPTVGLRDLAVDRLNLVLMKQ